jgi:hypothetical protein
MELIKQYLITAMTLIASDYGNGYTLFVYDLTPDV